MGEVPWKKCDMNTLIEDFKLFNRSLSIEELRA